MTQPRLHGRNLAIAALVIALLYAILQQGQPISARPLAIVDFTLSPITSTFTITQGTTATTQADGFDGVAIPLTAGMCRGAVKLARRSRCIYCQRARPFIIFQL